MPVDDPISPQLKDRVEKAKEARAFDDLLARLIAKRAYANHQLTVEEQRKVHARAKPAVTTFVNKHIVELVAQRDPLFGHDLQIGRKRMTFYRPEDTIRRQVRKILEEVLGPHVHRRELRQRVVGCMNLITYAVNIFVGDEVDEVIDEIYADPA